VPVDRSGDDALAEARRWLALAEDDLNGAVAMLERDDVAPRLVGVSPASQGRDL
jgi:hypothetical protein